MEEKKYIEFHYNDDSQEFLREYCKVNNFDLTTKFNGNAQLAEDFDFHTTIFFTTTEHKLKNSVVTLSTVIDDITPIKFSLFGDDDNVLVLEIESPKLRKIRNYFEEYGMQDTYPDYKPHITLSYKYNGAVPTELPDLTGVSGNIINIKTQK